MPQSNVAYSKWNARTTKRTDPRCATDAQPEASASLVHRRRVAHPFWFQSFGAVMGMDWHSSGVTTSVIGALKRGLGPLSGELGIHVCGGRGRHSRQTPQELLAIGERVGFDGPALA